MLFRNKYRIESSRLKGYDYSGAGAYYITIVTRNRECFFGDVVEDNMILNESGKIADKHWKEIPEHFPYAIMDEYIVMPNHMHGIIILDTSTEKRQPIGVIINQYKRACTIEIRKFNINFGWHPRFHDQIIRNEKSLNNIRKYIISNPLNWKSEM